MRLQYYDNSHFVLILKYHPDQWSNSKDSHDKFLKIAEAYATLCDPNAISGEDGACEIVLPSNILEAKSSYERVFGKYRRLYYGQASMIGFCYASDLKESLDKSVRLRNHLAFQLFRFKIQLFPNWTIKKDLNGPITAMEIVLTWIVVATCK